MHGTPLMPAIDNLLKRLGFVRLARYGLVLTPEGRIMSLRPAVLDDGLGGRIVGWPDGDLAAMELQKWEPARPAAKPAVATRLAVAPPPIPMPKPVAVTPATPVPVAVVAQPPQVEEDDWEWEIALARARVAAEESEQAAASVRAPRARLQTIPPPVAAPKLAVVQIPPIDEERTSPSLELVRERPLASPIGVRKQPTMPVATLPPPRPGTAPPTIIPVPRLPSIKGRESQIQPVVRTRMFAKGTGPISSGTQVGVPPPPPIRVGEDDDKTSPGMPAMAAAVSLPSVKRFAR